MTRISDRFLTESTRYLREVYLGRLERALANLPAEDLWWRPSEGRLSFATILIHLNGNVRQWVLGGIGGQPIERDRDAEFSATDGADGPQLLGDLRRTVQAAAEVIEGLDPANLAEERTIQGNDVDVQSAVYHVVEHFAYHTGQAVWISKARSQA